MLADISDSRFIEFEGLQRADEGVFKRIEGLEYAVMEMLLA